MKPSITAFKASPDEGQGQARDFRVRWAFEEVGQPYDVRLVTFEEMRGPSYRALQPFGQIPVYQEDDLVLFESGAIIFHIAETHAGLFPKDRNLRARAITWMFCALNTMEPSIVDREVCEYFENDRSWGAERMEMIDQRIHVRLKELSTSLSDSEWLVGEFSAADIMMVTVLRRLEGTGHLDRYSNLSSYVSRAKERPAYKRAFAAQLEVFNKVRDNH